MGNSRNIPKWMFRNETHGNDASLWAEKKIFTDIFVAGLFAVISY